MRFVTIQIATCKMCCINTPRRLLKIKSNIGNRMPLILKFLTTQGVIYKSVTEEPQNLK